MPAPRSFVLSACAAAAALGGAVLPSPAAAMASAVHVTFSEQARVRPDGPRVTSAAGADVTPVNAVLVRHGARIQRLFKAPAAELDAIRDGLRRRGRTAVPDLNRHYRITTSGRAEADALVAQLRDLPGVDAVSREPAPAPPPVTPDFTSMQGYRALTPDGMNVAGAGDLAGARGERVKVVDVEYSWNRDHEDLTRAAAAGAFTPNGTPWDPFDGNNHGTAVLGELVGDDSGFGVTGIVPLAGVGMVNAASDGCRCWTLANAIDVARRSMAPGDVMLIEQQVPAGGGGTDYVPVEWMPAVRDAIRVATQAGIIVVESAGNGAQDLDEPRFAGAFGAGAPSTGAIIVGAGSASCWGEARARLPSSTYGSRVDLQGWGECVTTTGYGDLQGSGTPNAAYTATFNGTSSAAAMVAGAAAAYSSLYEAAHGVAPSPRLVRDRLVATGTPQSGSDRGHIGPLPDLGAAAADFRDAVAPFVTRRTPAARAVDVAADAAVAVSFSEPVQGVSAATFRLRDAQTGSAVPAAVSRGATSADWVLQPVPALGPDRSYDVVLTGGPAGIRDVAGNALADDSWTFRTAAAAQAGEQAALESETATVPLPPPPPPDAVEVAEEQASGSPTRGVPGFSVPGDARVRDGALRFTFTCTGIAPCRGVLVQVRLLRNGKAVHTGSSRRISAIAGQRKRVTVPLDRRARRLVARRATTAVLVATDPDGRHVSKRFKISTTAPR